MRSCFAARTSSSAASRTPSSSRRYRAVATALKALGVAAGDRVAAYVPNMPEAIDRDAGRDEPGRRVVVVLAGLRRAGRARPLRADRAARAVHGRRLLVQRQAAADSRQGGRRRREAAHRRARRRHSVPRSDGTGPAGSVADPRRRRAGTRSSATSRPAPIEYARLPFDHPLYILFSSGTTGVPKCIVHGAGGTLLQHLKEHLLHSDSRRATGCSTSRPAAG